MWTEGEIKIKDTGFFLEECIIGCVQLIWIHGVQEFVLCVLGDMLGALGGVSAYLDPWRAGVCSVCFG